MTDLTKIREPFGLLDKETQEALRAYFHAGGRHYSIEHLASYTPGTCDWTKSLVYRPGYEPKGEE